MFKKSISLRGALTGLRDNLSSHNYLEISSFKNPKSRNKGKLEQKRGAKPVTAPREFPYIL
jgi:hypothetical protein